MPARRRLADALGAAKIFTSKAEAEAALLLAQNDVKRNLVVDPAWSR